MTIPPEGVFIIFRRTFENLNGSVSCLYKNTLDIDRHFVRIRMYIKFRDPTVTLFKTFSLPTIGSTIQSSMTTCLFIEILCIISFYQKSICSSEKADHLLAVTDDREHSYTLLLFSSEKSNPTFQKLLQNDLAHPTWLFIFSVLPLLLCQRNYQCQERNTFLEDRGLVHEAEIHSSKTSIRLHLIHCKQQNLLFKQNLLFTYLSTCIHKVRVPLTL